MYVVLVLHDLELRNMWLRLRKRELAFFNLFSNTIHDNRENKSN
jgi:hypothetical protein